MSVKQTELQKLKAENDSLRRICVDLHFMARRYADLRSSYAPSMVNDAVKYLQSIGVKLNPTGDNTLLARQSSYPEQIQKAYWYCNKCEGQQEMKYYENTRKVR